MQSDALQIIDQLFHVSTTYTGGGGDPITPPTACTVVFALRGMPSHAGEKPSIIDCSHNPTAQIAIHAPTELCLQHWLTLPDSFLAYAPRETFAQAALAAAAENLPSAT